MHVTTKGPKREKKAVKCNQKNVEEENGAARSQTDLVLRVGEGAEQATTTVSILFLASCGRYVPMALL